MSHILPVKANQFLCFHPSMFLCVLAMPHTSQSWIAANALYSYSEVAYIGEGGGRENKKPIQLIQLPAQKSHYTADEFKDCQR